MPELPEVETVRQSLLPLLVGCTIIEAELNYPNLLKNATPTEFSKGLTGRRFTDIKRRGKYLIFMFDNDYCMIVHLRMTGQLRYNDAKVPILKHTHFILDLDNGKQLRFVDVRKFGMIYIGSLTEVYKQAKLERLGPEPLEEEFTYAYLADILCRTRRKVKAVLLDQHQVAGLGNIYVDEALFRAGIHPESIAHCIPEGRVKKLHNCIRQVLLDGIANRGTSINDYVDGFGKKGTFQFELDVYRREGQLCHNCEHEVTKCRVAGRGTHVCLNCQTKYS